MVTFAAPTADEGSVWWLWVVGGLVVWFVAALLVGLVIGRGIRIADRNTPGTGVPLTTADLPAGFTPAVRVRRRAVPLPPVGIALAATAVLLETTGYVLRLNTGTTAGLLSMDDRNSLPRLFVTLLFASAAVAAVAGAGSRPGRRTWWLAVAAVTGSIAAVKAGGNVHAAAMNALAGAVGDTGALVLAGLAAAAVVGALWFSSRTDRRDRRRIVGVLTLYAVAAIGLSEISHLVAGAFGGGSAWTAAATYLEESGEALAGVGCLIAVLVGVAPRLVLPADWVLRRTADAQTLDVLPARRLGEGRTGR